MVFPHHSPAYTDGLHARQEFATLLVAVFCLTYHRGVGAGDDGRCSMHHTLRVSHLSRSLPLMPHHNAHVNRRTTDRCNRGNDGLIQQRISRLIALVVLGTKYLFATPL